MKSNPVSLTIKDRRPSQEPEGCKRDGSTVNASTRPFDELGGESRWHHERPLVLQDVGAFIFSFCFSIEQIEK